MADSWRFYRFDYAQYLELCPALRSVNTPAEFAALVDSADVENLAAADAIASAALNGEITIQEARHHWIMATCCAGQPLEAEGNFARLVAALGRRRGMEDAAETLAELAAGGKNLDSWLLPSFGLLGFLTPQETEKLAAECDRIPKSARLRSGKKRRGRRGGLFGFVRNFLRRLLNVNPQTDELLPLIHALLNEAAENGEGIAVVSG